MYHDSISWAIAVIVNGQPDTDQFFEGNGSGLEFKPEFRLPDEVAQFSRNNRTPMLEQKPEDHDIRKLLRFFLTCVRELSFHLCVDHIDSFAGFEQTSQTITQALTP